MKKGYEKEKAGEINRVKQTMRAERAIDVDMFRSDAERQRRARYEVDMVEASFTSQNLTSAGPAYGLHSALPSGEN